MKRKASGATPQLSYSAKKKQHQLQQRLPDSFTRKLAKFDSFTRKLAKFDGQSVSVTEMSPNVLNTNTRLISGTEGGDRDAFTTLMTAVATKKPVIVFSLNLVDGKLLSAITINSDRSDLSTNIQIPACDTSPGVSGAVTENSSSGSNNDPSPSDNPESLTWARECRLPKFSFCVQSGLPDPNSEDVELRIRTNILPKVNRPEDRCEGFPIHHSLLKSMLQKAVRRRLTNSAIRLSLALAHISTIELLRRLPIICLEDGALHPSFPVLVWCMIASSKGFLLPDYLLSVCVLIIADVSECQYMDCLTLLEVPQIGSFVSASTADPACTPPCITSSTEVSIVETVNINGTTPLKSHLQAKKPMRRREYDIRQQPASSARTLVLSIMLRAAFGGMAGDIDMLKKFSSLWFLRFFKGSGYESEASPSVKGSGYDSEASPSVTSANSFGCSSSAEDSVTPSSFSNSEDSLLMTQHPETYTDYLAYMHPKWLLSMVDGISSRSLWGRHCINSLAPLIETKAASTSLLTDSALSQLRSYIITSLNDGKYTPLALYAPHTALHTDPHTGFHAAPNRPSQKTTLTAFQPLLLLRSDDLVPEGIDFHCDGEIVGAVRDRCSSRIVSILESRGSLNGGGRRDNKIRGIQSHFVPTSSSSSTFSNDRSSSSSSNSSYDVSLLGGIDVSNSICSEVDSAIKSAIWMFRSSVNSHKLWPPPHIAHNSHGTNGLGSPPPLNCADHVGMETQSSTDTEVFLLNAQQQEMLKKKQQLAPFWGVICPSVRAYCEGRRKELEVKLMHYIRSTL